MKTVSIDLHGMTSAEAKKRLLSALKNCSGDVGEIEIVHGFNSGKVLLNMVRSLSHPRIDRKIVGMNNGVTIYVIKKL